MALLDRRRLALEPAHFLGSYTLPLTAHSGVLPEFGGGDGAWASTGAAARASTIPSAAPAATAASG